MIWHSWVRNVVGAGLVALSMNAIASDMPSVGVQIAKGGIVVIEGKNYPDSDSAALRAKLDEIRARVPKPALAIDLADGISDADSNRGMDLLFKAGIEQDLDH